MTNIVPTPQKNPIFAQQQDQAVMEQVKKKRQPDQRGEVQKAKERILKILILSTN